MLPSSDAVKGQEEIVSENKNIEWRYKKKGIIISVHPSDRVHSWAL